MLDWEYAHVGEPLWDLAGWSANNDFPFERRQELLSAYLGAVPPPARERFELLCWLYDYVCLLWSEFYLSDCSGSGAVGVGMGSSSGLGGAADVKSAAAVADRATLLDARLRLPAH